jgi:hypothetical protein
MTLHATVEYLKYRWKAMGRHGMHSPFVYDFIEQVVMDRDVIAKDFIVSYPSLALRYENILSRIAAYYKYKTIVYFEPGMEAPAIDGQADMLLIGQGNPKQWQQVLSEYKGVIKSSGMVVVMGIHISEEHSLAWSKLCKDTAVRMSIDMYGMGLLSFRKESKERQHFVLRC